MNIDEMTLEVRRAYRLIHSYQKAMLDLAKEIGTRLKLDFYYWDALLHDRPVSPKKNPFDRSSWEMLPMYHTGLTFVTPGKVRAGSLMLMVIVLPDTAYEEVWEKTKGRKEPDFRLMTSVEKSESLICLWYVRVESCTENIQWDSIFDPDWPEEAEFNIINIPGVQLRGGLLDFKLSDFSDANAIDVTLQQFRRKAGVE